MCIWFFFCEVVAVYLFFFFFSSRRRHTRLQGDWSSDVCSSDLPLWAVYPQWGWTTEDAERALGHLRRFGSVTVLNGHIHQVLQKVEGTVTFHTAMSTAFPQPAPGSAPAPGPMKIPEAEARRMIGVTDVRYVPGQHPLAVVDSTLG